MSDEKWDHLHPTKPPSKPNFERPPGHSRPGRTRSERPKGVLSVETHLKEKLVDDDPGGNSQ